MKDGEKKLFKELVKIENDKFDETLLSYASPYVLGQLFFNRMQGVAFEKLSKLNLLNKTNREFRNSLRAAYEKNVEKNESFYKCIAMISHILSTVDVKAAMLKGAVLCSRYPKGCRTSNDIDLLVLSKDVTKVGNALLEVGFKQGNIINGNFVAASRKEIIESKMMRGETVPYIKEVNLPSMKYLEIDVNFSLDYKNGDENLLIEIIDAVDWIDIGNVKIPTLSKEDFFIHLCAHLYKEATTFAWIKMNRDMTLYKYYDIYLLLMQMEYDEIVLILERAKKLGLEKVCAYCILEVVDFFEMENGSLKLQAQRILSTDTKFRLTVINPSENKKFLYNTVDVTERFFMENRMNDLTEVGSNEKAENA